MPTENLCDRIVTVLEDEGCADVYIRIVSAEFKKASTFDVLRSQLLSFTPKERMDEYTRRQALLIVRRILEGEPSNLASHMEQIQARLDNPPPESDARFLSADVVRAAALMLAALQIG